MGWAMCRTENGEAVESEQGQDVYTTSNYVFAQLLDYYGLSKESKEVYKAMDKVIFQYANTLISPDNLRAELEKEEGELTKGPVILIDCFKDFFRCISRYERFFSNRNQIPQCI